MVLGHHQEQLPDSVVIWSPATWNLNLAVLTGHRSRIRKGLIYGAVGGGVAAIQVAIAAAVWPEGDCALCAQPGTYGKMLPVYGGVLAAFGFLLGLAADTEIWKDVRRLILHPGTKR